MKKHVFFLFLLPLWGFSQSFTDFALNPNGDVSLGDFVEANGKLYFSAATLSNNKTGLWVTDGTIAGTQLLVDINPGPAPSEISAMVEFGN